MTAALSAFLDMQDDVPEAVYHRCPPDKLVRSEEQRVQEFLRLLPYVAPSLEVFAIPNAGKRTRWEVTKAKREGLKAGVADMHVAWNHGAAWLEWKNGRDYPDPNQRAWLSRMTRLGHRVAVVRTADAAFRLLAEQGAPVDLQMLEGLR